jgi:hypothetical protein
VNELNSRERESEREREREERDGGFCLGWKKFGSELID